MIPQGFGAALMMPIAGAITDRAGPGRVVLVGLWFICIGMFGFSQVGADTSFALLCGFSFVNGLGMGASMMPSMSAAYQTLNRAAVPRATTAMNIIQRVGGSIGIALLSVILANQISGNLPPGAAAGSGGAGDSLAALANVPPAAHDAVMGIVADAFGHAYLWALVICAVAVVPALMLPRHKPRPAPGQETALDEAAPVAVFD
jgi:MFS family permease